MVILLKMHGCRRRGYQEGGRNAFSSYIGNDDLNAVRVDRDIVVIIAAHAPRRLHHAGYLESGNGGVAHGEKKNLGFPSPPHRGKGGVPPLLNCFWLPSPPPPITPQSINNK